MEHIRLRCLIILNKNYKIFIFVICVFSFFIGDNLNYAKNTDALLFEFVLISVSDFHYLTFFALPVYCYFLFSSYSSNPSMSVVRYQSFCVYFMNEIIPISLFAFFYSICPAIVATIIGIISGLPIEGRKGSLLLADSDNIIVSTELEYFDKFAELIRATGSSCIISILCTVVYMSLGLIFISMMIRFMLYVLSKKVVLLSVIAAYIFDVIVVQLALDKVPSYLCLNNYFVLIDAFVNNAIATSVVIMFAVFAVIYLCLKKRWGCRNIC